VRLAGLATLATIVVYWVYWPAIHGTLLWDDAAHVTRPALRTLAGLWRIWFDLGATQQYYPLVHSAFWIQARLWGDSVVGYHAVSVGLHAYSAVVVALIVRRLGLPGAWLAALLFALHPVHVESVAWITEQKNTLSGAFYLTAALAYLQFDRTRARRWYAAAAVLFLCAILSKSAQATLPAALLVVFWWQRGRLEWRRDVAWLLPWLVAGAAAGLFTAWVEQTYIGAAGPDFALSVLDRVLIAGRVLWFYAASLVWPANLMFNYPRWDVDPAVWWQYLFPVGAMAVLGLAWRLRHRTRGPLAALLFFAGTLVPVLGFFNVYPFVYSFVADHFVYIASLGLIVPAAVVAAHFAGRAGSRSWLVTASVVAITLVLAGLSHRQSAMYADVVTLYTETSARNPGSWMAEENLGVLLATQPGRLPDAIRAFRRAVAIRPDRPSAHRNLAMALGTAGEIHEALAEYARALDLDPAHVDDHLQMSRLLLQMPGRAGDAMTHLNTALHLAPRSATAHELMGTVLLRQGDADAAEDQFRAAIRDAPSMAEAYLNLGTILERSGRLEEAIGAYGRAVVARPDYAKAHYNLGSLLIDLPDRQDDAVAHLEAAVRLRPGDARAESNLGLALSEMPGRQRDAIRHLQSALRIDPTLGPPRELLGQLEASNRPGDLRSMTSD
jgi:tetratricopeptide (TPR) repeat protein